MKQTKQTKPKYDIVEVEWLDAQTGFGQPEHIEDLVKYAEPLHTYSVGYLMHQDKEKIILGFMLFGEDMIKHNQLIPKAIIKRMVKLKRAR